MERLWIVCYCIVSLLIWQLTRTGVFDVPSFCNSLFIFDKSLFIIHYWKRLLFLSLGRAFGVLRYLKGWSFFLWTAARFGILTIDNLVKKKLPLVNWCCLCCFFFFFISIAYVVMRKLWIIFCSIVSLLMLCGVSLSYV